MFKIVILEKKFKKKLEIMNKIFYIDAPAKLNLNLFVKEKLKNGLHSLESDICFLELTDNIYFKSSDEDIFLQANLDNTHH